MKAIAKLWIGLAILIVLTPLGLILPAYFKSGSAWGEWGTDVIKKVVGYVPRGLEKLSSLWIAPLPDYAVKSSEAKGLAHGSLSYFVSVLIGVTVVVLVTWLIGRSLSKKGD